MRPRTPGPPADPLSEWYGTKLEDILPSHGFVYPEGHKIFEAKEDWVLVKWAIEAAAPNLEEHEVDAALAAVMSTANALMKYYHGSSRNFTNIDGQTRNRVFNGIMEAARGEHEWTVIIPEGRLPTLMKKLFRARALYNELSHIRGMPEEDKYKQDGKLAQAIDQWIGSRPVEEPDERYARMHQHIIDYIVDKKIKGERVEWDFAIGDFSGDDSEDDGGNQRWIPWRELWYGKSAKSPSDEDAGWVHNNYFWNEKDDEDGEMTNALLLYN